MKVILAQCAGLHDPNSAERRGALVAALEREGHKTELVELPALPPGIEGLTAMASHRLMNLGASCDALICLDPVAALVRHSRKIAFLLAPADATLAGWAEPERSYAGNVLRSALTEAKSISPGAARKTSGSKGPAASTKAVSTLLKELSA